MFVGYSGSGAANSSLLVFDTITSVFVSSYEPPSPQTFSSITTLLPSPTSSPPSSHPSQHSASVSATSSNPSSTNSDDPSSSSNATNPHTTVIALGAVFGVVALLAGTTVLTWYMRRHPRGSQESFHLLSPSPDDDSPHMGRIIPIVGAGTTGSTGTREKGGPPITNTVRDKFYSFVGGRFGTQQGRRRDMLADEDTRQFDAEFGAGWWGSSHGRDGSGSGAGLRRGTSSGQSSWRSVMRPATLTDRVHDSFVSLRNVGGAMLGYTAGTSGSGGRREANASGGSRSTRWRAEKEPSDPFGDKYGVNKPLPSPSSPPPSPRPRGSRQGSSFGYQDPFQDYEVEPFNYDYDSRRGYIRRGSEEIDEDGYPALLDPPPKPHLPAKVPASHPSSAIAVDITYLSPVSEHPSLSTLSDSNNIINLNTPSDSSHTSLLHTLGTSATFENTQTSSSPSQSLDTPRSPQKRPSSIIDANPPPSLLTMGSIRRSGSWWTRFAKTPLLDRRLSSTSRTSHGPIEIRDPNPLPPRLVPIKESSGSSPESSHIQSNSHPRNESGGDLEGGDDLFGQGNRKRGGHAQIYSSHLHGRSASSFQTSKTANSEMLERVGRTLDIVQRGSYYSDRSHSLSTEGRRMSSTGSGLGLEDDEGIPPVPPLSIVTSATAAMSSQTHSNRLSAGGSILNESGTLVQSPEDSVGGEMETTIKGRPSSGYGYSHPSIGLISSRRSSPSPTQPLLPLPPPSSYSPPPRRKSPKTGQGNVASRIQAFERRMSQESPQSGSSPQSQILSFQKRKEERPKSPLSPGTKTRSRGASVYGVVPKPELFVANPDLRERSSSG